MNNVEIIDSDYAKVWISEMEWLNGEMSSLLKETGQTLIELKESADGSIIDDLYHWGSNMQQTAATFFKANDELIQSVKKVITELDDTMQSFEEILRKLTRNITPKI